MPRIADALILFGITGDLAKKKLFSALYTLEAAGELNCPVIGVASSNWTEDELKANAREALGDCGLDSIDEAVFDRFAKKLKYVQGDYREAATFERVSEAVGDAKCPVAYLAIPPFLFRTVADGLGATGLNRGRVVLEKPFGRDLESSRDLDAQIRRHYDESSIYRIDHFLGKEPVLNLLVTRFANSILEPLWNRKYIKSVCISMHEAFGVEGRGKFYDEVGTLRDVVQNHLLLIIGLLAMEPPVDDSAEAMANEVAKVMKSMKSFDPKKVWRGQYEGYLDEEGVVENSDSETFIAIEAEIDSWRWAGVPWRIEAGKALSETVTEATIEFIKPPKSMFSGHAPEPNTLKFVMKPNDLIELGLQAKAPGSELRSEPVTLVVDHHGMEDGPSPYHRLLGDALVGDKRLFARGDQVDEAWRIVQPVIDNPCPVETYPYGAKNPRL